MAALSFEQIIRIIGQAEADMGAALELAEDMEGERAVAVLAAVEHLRTGPLAALERELERRAAPQLQAAAARGGDGQ